MWKGFFGGKNAQANCVHGGVTSHVACFALLLQYYQYSTTPQGQRWRDCTEPHRTSTRTHTEIVKSTLYCVLSRVLHVCSNKCWKRFVHERLQSRVAGNT